MAPSTTVEVRPEPIAKKSDGMTHLVLEDRETSLKARKPQEVRPVHLKEDFLSRSMIENNRVKSSSRFLDLLISFSLNAAILVGPIFFGLYFTDSINLRQFDSTFLIAPPPPPPPPPAAAAIVRAAPVRRVFENAGRLIAPTVVPKNIADIKEEPIPPDAGIGGVAGGVPGGVAGGSMSGVIGGVIGGMSTAVPMAPTGPKDKGPKAPVRVGGRVKQPRVIHREDPIYPALARQIHMQGVVVIDAILDEQGNVVEARITSGPPLLLQAALDAVKKWKYEPTYLNDEPVPVQLNVTVTFQLNN